MADWIPGADLSEYFYAEAVRRILDAEHQGLRHAAALIGTGSEVLGFDTPRSADHSWGARLTVFVPEKVYVSDGARIESTLSRLLPESFRGHAVDLAVVSPRRFFIEYLEFDIGGGITTADWLTFPSQKLRSIRDSRIFHDDMGFSEMRERFRSYPRDVWLYLMAAGWARIGQEEHFIGRTGEVGDDLGSRLIAGRLVRDAMRLAFLMERDYPPYAKWFGSAFAKLRSAALLTPPLEQALRAAEWQARADALNSAFEILAEMHNALDLTAPLPTEPSPFHDRPFSVIHGEVFADALRAVIEDEDVRRIATRPPIGSIDQFSDSTDLAHSEWRESLKALFD